MMPTEKSLPFKWGGIIISYFTSISIWQIWLHGLNPYNRYLIILLASAIITLLACLSLEAYNYFFPKKVTPKREITVFFLILPLLFLTIAFTLKLMGYNSSLSLTMLRSCLLSIFPTLIFTYFKIMEAK